MVFKFYFSSFTQKNNSFRQNRMEDWNYYQISRMTFHSNWCSPNAVVKLRWKLLTLTFMNLWMFSNTASWTGKSQLTFISVFPRQELFLQYFFHCIRDKLRTKKYYVLRVIAVQALKYNWKTKLHNGKVFFRKWIRYLFWHFWHFNEIESRKF